MLQLVLGHRQTKLVVGDAGARHRLERGGLERDVADALSEAFTAINGIRFEHHAARVEAGLEADNLIDPSELTPIARAELREALQVVRKAQRRVGAWSPP